MEEELNENSNNPDDSSKRSKMEDVEIAGKQNASRTTPTSHCPDVEMDEMKDSHAENNRDEQVPKADDRENSNEISNIDESKLIAIAGDNDKGFPSNGEIVQSVEAHDCHVNDDNKQEEMKTEESEEINIQNDDLKSSEQENPACNGENSSENKEIDNNIEMSNNTQEKKTDETARGADKDVEMAKGEDGASTSKYSTLVFMSSPSSSSSSKNMPERKSSAPKRRNYRRRLVSSSSDDSISSAMSLTRSVRKRLSENVSNSSASNAQENSSNVLTLGDLFPVFPIRFEPSESSSSSSDSNDYNSPHVVDSDDSHSNVSDESINKEVLSSIEASIAKPKPQYTWNSVYETMYREYGLSGKGRLTIGGRDTALGFQSRFYSSRHIVEKMGILHPLEKHQGCVNSLNFSRSGDLLVSGSDDLKIILWNWASGKIKCAFSSGHTSNVFQTKFIELKSGINIVSSGRDGHVRQFMIPPSGASKAQSRVLVKHDDAVHKIVSSPNCPYEILTAGEDGHVIRCDLREGPVNRMVTVKVQKRKVPLYSIAHHPFDSEFCVSGRNQNVIIYDKRNTKKALEMMCPKHLEDKRTYGTHVTCAVYNNTGTEILASYIDEDIYLFNNRCYVPGEYTHRYRGHMNSKTIKGVNFFGLNSEYVISGSDCGHFFFWEKNTESIINWIKGDFTGVVNCLEPHPSFPILATSGLDHDVKIWMPSKIDYPPEMEDLRKRVKANIRRPALTNHDLFYDRPFFFFVRQFLRTRQQGAGTDDNCPYVGDLVSSSSEEEDECEPDDDDNFQLRPLPCTPQ